MNTLYYSNIQSLLKLKTRHTLKALHTLQYATSFCAKGSLQNHNQCFGEDSAKAETIITPGKLQGCSLFAVADGVGGWRRHGVDSSFLSQGLTREISKIFLKNDHKIPPTQQVLTSAFTKLYNAGPIYAGGTTVCMGLFDPRKASIEVLNLGDSGAIVCRNGKIVHSTISDVDGLVPKQLTVLPEGMHPSQFSVDLRPEIQSKGTVTNWKLESHDFLLFGTDGFFDNIHPHQIVKILDGLKNEYSTGIQEIADKLLTRAYYNSLDPNYASPFALRMGDYVGGKPDDMSIICGVVH